MEKLAALTERGLKVFTGTLLAAMVVVILLQVTFRYALNLSLAWTEEVGRYLFVWICLFGASLAYRYGQHSGLRDAGGRPPGGRRPLGDAGGGCARRACSASCSSCRRAS